MDEPGVGVELFIDLNFKAVHSLEEVEKPHYHVWRVRVGVTGPVVHGRIASLPHLRSSLQQVLDPLQEVYLNESTALDADTRRDPTCENLCVFLADAFTKKIRADIVPATPGLRLSSIEVAVLEMNGEETGFARMAVPA